MAELEDARVLVVEYKGKLENAKDSAEKKRLGELWESRSGGLRVFLWAQEEAVSGRSLEQQIAAAVKREH